MTGDGSSTGDGPLEGRMNLLLSKVDSKIFFHKDAVVEYMEMKHLIGGIAEEKARVEQEALRRAAAAPPELLVPVLEQLAAAREELATTKKVLAARNEELAAMKEELAVAKKERDEKDEELKATIAKAQEFEALKNQYEQQSESGVALDSVQDQPLKQSLADHCASTDDELEGLRETLIKEFMQIDCGGRVLGVKEMGRLDEKPFHDACAAKLPPKEAKREASKLYASWEKLLKNQSWKPFKTDAVGDNSQEEAIDVDDDMLQELKRAWGEGTHNAVVRALMEMREYNRLSSRSTTYELWNYKAGRKATTLECVDHMSKQVKQLSMSKRRKTRRSAGTA